MPTIRMTSGPRSGETVSLEEELVIGRDPSTCQLVLEDDQVSRQHARISRGAGGTWVLSDLGSTNGTWVTPSRGRRRQVTGDHVLQGGDRIEVGGTRLVYAAEAPEATVVVGGGPSGGGAGVGRGP